MVDTINTLYAASEQAHRTLTLSTPLDDLVQANAVERTIRPIALNRKNALFAGHDAGAANWGVIASLIETCKLNAVDPHAYLADTLNLAHISGTASKVAEQAARIAGVLTLWRDLQDHGRSP